MGAKRKGEVILVLVRLLWSFGLMLHFSLSLDN